MLESSYIRTLLARLIKKYDLDLSGLTVLTEVASGAYLFNPFVALMSGAENVLLFGRDSRYGRIADVRNSFEGYAKLLGFSSYSYIDSLSSFNISSADIITNSGHLRPFSADVIRSMKKSSVLPLMWEPWEMREGEIDLAAARDHGVLILGTNEHEPPCDMRPYSLLLALKLMMEQGSSIVDENIIIFGDQYSLAVAIEEGLSNLGYKCCRISVHSDKISIKEALSWGSYLLVAEHHYKDYIIGGSGLITSDDFRMSSVVNVGIIAGMVDPQIFIENGIRYFPEIIQPVGYMSYQPYEIGPYPVMDLFAAGLKVGQVASRARLKGMSVEEAAKYALMHSPALDLIGDYSWIKN